MCCDCGADVVSFVVCCLGGLFRRGVKYNNRRDVGVL